MWRVTGHAFACHTGRNIGKPYYAVDRRLIGPGTWGGSLSAVASNVGLPLYFVPSTATYSLGLGLTLASLPSMEGTLVVPSTEIPFFIFTLIKSGATMKGSFMRYCFSFDDQLSCPGDTCFQLTPRVSVKIHR